MNYRLSVAIPVYNFAKFLPETLDTIINQEGIENVEVLIFDGGSTDHTPALVEQYQKLHPHLRYVRRPCRGGIDKDMASCVAESSGDYVWLFSGDDLFLPGSIKKALNLIESGVDLYLTRHYEWRDYEKDWIVWPTVDAKDQTTFDLSVQDDRKEYFRRAQTTEAFFSFIGGLIVKKKTWERVSINNIFVGSCWAHVARFFELMSEGLTICVLYDAYLKRRPDNDTFSTGSFISRYALTINGFVDISTFFFGSYSPETREIKRVLRREYHPLAMQLGKYLCLTRPKEESIHLLNDLLHKIYDENTFECWKTKISYKIMNASSFRKLQPILSAKYDKDP